MHRGKYRQQGLHLDSGAESIPRDPCLFRTSPVPPVSHAGIGPVVLTQNFAIWLARTNVRWPLSTDNHLMFARAETFALFPNRSLFGLQRQWQSGQPPPISPGCGGGDHNGSALAIQFFYLRPSKRISGPSASHDLWGNVDPCKTAARTKRPKSLRESGEIPGPMAIALLPFLPNSSIFVFRAGGPRI